MIKQNVSIPVAAVGGINSPEQAEEAIAAGKIDMVSMGRQFFADPAFPNRQKLVMQMKFVAVYAAEDVIRVRPVNMRQRFGL